MGYMKELAIAMMSEQTPEQIERGFMPDLPDTEGEFCECCQDWTAHPQTHTIRGEGVHFFCSNLCLEHWLKYHHYDTPNMVQDEPAVKCDNCGRWYNPSDADAQEVTNHYIQYNYCSQDCHDEHARQRQIDAREHADEYREDERWEEDAPESYRDEFPDAYTGL